MRALNRVLLTAVGCVLAACSGPENQAPDATPGPTSSPEMGTADPDGASSAATGYTIQHTSWGRVEEASENAPEKPPLRVSKKEGRWQKLEREAADRWKNVEIFVKRY